MSDIFDVSIPDDYPPLPVTRNFMATVNEAAKSEELTIATLRAALVAIASLEMRIVKLIEIVPLDTTDLDRETPFKRPGTS